MPEPDSPVITTSASRGSVSEMSLRLCSRAPETTIWLLAAISSSLYEGEQTFACGRYPSIAAYTSSISFWRSASSKFSAR